jgi:hypothetical protein
MDNTVDAKELAGVPDVIKEKLKTSIEVSAGISAIRSRRPGNKPPGQGQHALVNQLPSFKEHDIRAAGNYVRVATEKLSDDVQLQWRYWTSDIAPINVSFAQVAKRARRGKAAYYKLTLQVPAVNGNYTYTVHIECVWNNIVVYRTTQSITLIVGEFNQVNLSMPPPPSNKAPVPAPAPIQIPSRTKYTAPAPTFVAVPANILALAMPTVIKPHTYEYYNFIMNAFNRVH